MNRSFVLWLGAIFLGIGVMLFQRLTGPTYPKRIKVKIEQQTIQLSLPRSWTSGENAVIDINAPKLPGQFYISYRRYKSYDVWQTDTFSYQNGKYVYQLPTLPPAGKMMYMLVYAGKENVQITSEPVILRYKGFVPTWILVIHVLMMVLSVFWGLRAGLEAMFRRKQLASLTLFATLFLFVGGLILGPIVQYYAFGAFWTGWPMGHDLTDNKTLISFIMWLVALWKIRKNPLHWKIVLLASVVQLIMYFIPHSVLGSEIDFTKE